MSKEVKITKEIVYFMDIDEIEKLFKANKDGKNKTQQLLTNVN